MPYPRETAYITRQFGREIAGKIKPCYIADRKRYYGLTKRIAWNRIDPAQPKHPCRPELRHYVDAAIRFVHGPRLV